MREKLKKFSYLVILFIFASFILITGYEFVRFLEIGCAALPFAPAEAYPNPFTSKNHLHLCRVSLFGALAGQSWRVL